MEQSLLDVALMNCRPSVVAAAVLYADRRRRGVIPFWPTMLAKLTGYGDMGSPELSAAIKAALRLAGQAAVSGSGSPGQLCAGLSSAHPDKTYCASLYDSACALAA